jgi:hypothetical protein
MVLDAELIETIEPTPDTVITMIDCRNYMVEGHPDHVAGLAVRDRTTLLRGRAPERTGAGAPPRASLHLIDEKRRND